MLGQNRKRWIIGCDVRAFGVWVFSMTKQGKGFWGGGRESRAGLEGLAWGSPCSHWHCCSPGCTPCWRCASADADTVRQEQRKAFSDKAASGCSPFSAVHWAVTLAASSLCLWVGLSGAGLLLLLPGLWLKTGLFAKSLMSLFLHRASCPAWSVASNFSLSSR